MRNQVVKKQLLVLTAVILSAMCASTQAQPYDWDSHHFQRTAPNRVPNPSVDGPDGYELGEDPKGQMEDPATYDPHVSRTPGSGAFGLHEPWWRGGRVWSPYIQVTPGKVYTFSVHIKTEAYPPELADLDYLFYDAGKKQIARGGSRWGTTDVQVGVWEECTDVGRAPAGAAYVRIEVNKIPFSQSEKATLWVDDFYIGEGVSFDQPPSRKKPFNWNGHAGVRIDELGNFEVFREGQWQPFFPRMIYFYGQEYAVFAQRGYNVISHLMLHASAVERTQRAKAVGMMSCIWPNAIWYKPYEWAWKHYELVPDVLESLRSAGLMDAVFGYFFDNETYQAEVDSNADRWEVPKKTCELIHQHDPVHPILQLDGNFGMARMYNHLVDSVGCYVGEGLTGGASAGTRGLLVLDNIAGQRNPLWAEFNGPYNWYTVYMALINGAKAFNHYIEGTVEDLKGRPDWSVIPDLHKEIDALLPLIRLPHWTKWRVTCDNETDLVWGTREYVADGKREGYVIVANKSKSPVTITFRVQGLPYKASSVKSLFVKPGVYRWDGPDVARYGNDSFTVTIPGGINGGRAVYRLVNPDGPGEPSLSR